MISLNIRTQPLEEQSLSRGITYWFARHRAQSANACRLTRRIGGDMGSSPLEVQLQAELQVARWACAACYAEERVVQAGVVTD